MGATFIVKDGEVVLTFQGTKLQEFAMFEFTIKQEPIFFEYKNYQVATAPPNGAVMTEGLAMYIYQLLNCIDSIFYNIGASGFKNVDYITGHSLGGSAATVYAQLQTPYGKIGSPHNPQSAYLVTFGAPATFNRKCLQGMCPQMKYAWGARATSVKVAPEEIMFLMEAATMHSLQDFESYDACMGKVEKVSKYQLAFVPNSIRFMHKFDPIPSIGFQMGEWSHGTQYGLLLFDLEECAGRSPRCSMGTVESTGMVYEGVGTPEALPDFLCSSGVMPSAKMFQCNPEYYSYTNMFNPVPCLEVLLAQVYLYDKFLGDASYPADSLPPFLPFEDYDLCAASYTATVSMYYELYLAADIAMFPAMETDFQDILDTKYYSDNELMIAIGYWAVWSLIYVHMSYPNYPLCVDEGTPFYGAGGKMEGMVSPYANGVASDLDKIKDAIPEWDEIISWYEFEIEGEKKKKGPRG